MGTNAVSASVGYGERGREFGTVTGRRRRCGWFDAVATRYAQMVNGIDELAITNLDGLDTLKELKICIAYTCRGKKLQYPPNDAADLALCKPVYRKFAGWQKPTGDIRHFKKLPVAAQKYLNALADLTGARLRIVSVGAQRDETFKV